MRINPDTGLVDMTVSLVIPENPAEPYNYSDMTGFNNRIVNPGGCPLKGYWMTIEDGGSSDLVWSVSWIATTPSPTGFEVFVRASDERETLSNKQFVPASSGVQVTGVRGHYLEVRAALSRENCAQDPYLESLTICHFSKTLQLIQPLPADQTVSEGQNTQFQVFALGTDPLNYQWKFTPDGSYTEVNVGPDSSVLSLPAVDCLDKGDYRVVVTDASGDQVATEPVTLTVNSRTITIVDNAVASVYPAEITVVGGPTSISHVEVDIYGFTHGRPDDVDILLVPPNGPAIMLMSDAGGTTAVAGLFLNFNQSNNDQPLDNGPLTGGGYKPSNYGESESLPGAPPGPYSINLDDPLLLGKSANGTWSLYIVDDTGGFSGSISGSWCLYVR